MEKIIVECYLDTLLIDMLGFKDYIHSYHSSIGEVANTMKKYFDKKPVLGIIDNDKSSIPSYFIKEFETVKTKHGIIHKKHHSKKHHLILITPAAENFLLKAADAVGVTRSNFKLPSNEKTFKNICKQEKEVNQSNFKNYVHAVIANNPASLTYLKNTINAIIKSP